MFTRAQYLAATSAESSAAHRRYYGEIVEECGVAVHPLIVERARAALAKGDTALNTIPLVEWDGMWLAPVARALKARGDYLTPAGKVCLLKEAARRKAEAPE